MAVTTATITDRAALRQIRRANCALCRQQGQDVPATCAIIGYVVRGLCDACGEQAEKDGKVVVFAAVRELPLVG